MLDELESTQPGYWPRYSRAGGRDVRGDRQIRPANGSRCRRRAVTSRGALIQGGRTVGYYNSTAAAHGLQAGAQWFGYGLFFMNQGALQHLDDSSGFEIGAGPSVVVVDSGMAKKLTSSTLTQDIYAMISARKA